MTRGKAQAVPVDIPVHRIARHCNPYRGEEPWGCLVTKRDVRRALAERRLVSAPGSSDHAGRIAYLVENEADDAIEVEVGAPALQCYVGWFLYDGNHRLAAAIYAGRSLIKASVGGDLGYAKRLFGVECKEPS